MKEREVGRREGGKGGRKKGRTERRRKNEW